MQVMWKDFGTNLDVQLL